jgi:hypothetical protein
MSQAQLLEIEKTLLKTLSLRDLEDFILRLASKTYEKKRQRKATLPVHIKKEIGKSLAEIKEGKYTLINNKLELTNHLQNLKNQANV